MKFSCERAFLHAAVTTAARAASSRSPIPALEGILIEAGQNNVKLTGYDLKKGIYTKVEAEVPEQGSIVLNARIFSNIVSSLPEGTVMLKTDGMNVNIKCENAEFEIIGSDAADYPELPTVDKQSAIQIPQSILSCMIRQTIFAVSDNESRPIYTGELFEIGNGMLTLVAVDGYRLAMRKEAIEGAGEDCSFIVPGNALSDLEKLCSDTEEPVQISLGSKHISFAIGETVLISRRLEGEFLDYRKTVPQLYRVELLADRYLFQRTVERVSLLIDEKVKTPVRCIFGESQVTVVCATSLGKAEDCCMLEGNGGELEIGFNNRYLLDALRAVTVDEIKIRLNTGASPCVVVPVEGDAFLYMILPVRLKSGE